MATKNNVRLDTKGLEFYIKKLNELGADTHKAVETALQQTAEKVKADTHTAMQPQFLPARGDYSSGDTKQSIIDDTSVRWEGDVAWVPVGFDFSKPGAGGWLITGTPHMAAKELRKMYKDKKYMNDRQREVADVLKEFIAEAMTK